jgi:chemotaxis protein methyltransferase CheR
VNTEFAFSAPDFLRVRELIAAYAGIALHERKQNMVYNRLARRLRATGTRTFREYLDWVAAPDSEERERFVNALTTNLTAFFREPHHFDMLVTLARSRPGARLRVWSSACSTGEEAYSAAIALAEVGRAAEILASDIDTDALQTARRAVYRSAALEGLGEARLRAQFLCGTGPNEGFVRVRPERCAQVRFAQRNLLSDDWLSHECFDAIFCRNVMIYFDRPTQQKVLDRLAAALAPRGLLFLGHSESCAAGHSAFRFFGKTAYERRDG